MTTAAKTRKQVEVFGVVAITVATIFKAAISRFVHGQHNPICSAKSANKQTELEAYNICIASWDSQHSSGRSALPAPSVDKEVLTAPTASSVNSILK
jgi:hypothetical protein